MTTTNLNELAWLHDCVLLDVIYDASRNNGRLVKWKILCPEDLGYPAWAGKELVLVAANVELFRHIAWGVAGRDTISAIRPGISETAQESTMDARRAGVRFPELEFTIDMHSGSSIEVICRRLDVNMGSA